jgi:hypothetical protein
VLVKGKLHEYSKDMDNSSYRFLYDYGTVIVSYNSFGIMHSAQFIYKSVLIIKGVLYYISLYM